MSSINFFNSTYNTPTINTLHAGLSLGSGDDFLSPRKINHLGSGFVGTVQPAGSSGQFGFRNPSPTDVLFTTNGFTSGVSPVDSNANYGTLYKLPYLPFNYYQGVPDFGTNPDASVVLAGSVQFQQDLRTVGPSSAPGFPAIGFGINPQAIDFLQGTNNFIGSFIPHHPTPYGYGYGFVPFQPPHQYQQPYYPPFFPPQNPYYNPYFCQPYYPPFFPPFPAPPLPPVAPDPNRPTTASQLYNIVGQNPFQLPDYIPTSSLSGAYNFIKQFNQLAENERVDVRQTLANPTTVDMDILNSTGITSTGGAYGQGVVNNPFSFDNFLTDTNPFAETGRGITITNGNGNGKVKGTPQADVIFGTFNRNNIIDGRGGQDDIIGSTQNELMKIYQGDHVFTDDGDDLLFYDFTQPPTYQASRITYIDGGEGEDTLVLTVHGDPSQDANVPQFSIQQNGLINVLYNGVQLMTRNIDKFIIVDTDGNIGSVYHTS